MLQKKRCLIKFYCYQSFQDLNFRISQCINHIYILFENTFNGNPLINPLMIFKLSIGEKPFQTRQHSISCTPYFF